MNFDFTKKERFKEERLLEKHLHLANDIIIKNARVYSPQDGLDEVTDVLVNADGIIEKIDKDISGFTANVLDAHDLVLTPAFIDLHCHLREPGFSHKETIESGTKAAAAGGFAVVCAMPNTNPAIDNVATIEYFLDRAEDASVYVLLIAAITKGREGQALSPMNALDQAGAIAFSDDGCSVSDAQIASLAFAYSQKSGKPIMEHCEEPSLAKDGQINDGIIATRLGLCGIPNAAEEVIVARDIALARQTGARLHICHISTAGAVELVRQAKKEGLKVTAEVTPHHLVLDESECLGYNTNAKVNPPLRSLKDREALIAGLNDGTIDAIATDHAPHTAHEKDCEFAYAPFGISGLETAFALVNSLIKDNKISLETAIRALTQKPAAILGIKSTIKVGEEANLVAFDMNEKWLVEAKDFKSKGHNTPLEGRTVQGRVKLTIAKGAVAYKEI
ncbi:MAG: dihydroorotase [Chloroflexi bacterium]|nr:dihydroorotase [Chloroflexota bacterium]